MTRIHLGKNITLMLTLGTLVALGCLSLIGVLSFLSPPPAEADIQGIANSSPEIASPDKMALPPQTPLQGTGSVTASATIVNNPLTPGDPATFTFRFTTDTNINTGEDITFTWPKEFLVPASINQNQVTIASSANTGCPPLGVIATDIVAPSQVSVAFVGPDRVPVVTIRVPDMNGGAVCPGNQGLGATGVVTAEFRQAAGIRNAEEADDDYQVLLSTPAGNATYLLNVPWMVDISSPDGVRGDTLTVVGRGFKNGTTVTFWRDANADGVRQVNEAGPTGLCQGVSGDDFVAVCSFTVNNPPFKPRRFDSNVAGASCQLPAPVACNYINAIDGRQNTVDLDLFPSPQGRLDLQTFDLRGSLTASPNTGRPGDFILVQIRDFPPNQPLTSLTLGGVITAIPTNAFTDSNGSANFLFQIPNGPLPGVQELAVRSNPSGGVDSTIRRTNITVLGGNLILSHQQVVPNQTLTISGSGFTQSTSQVCIERGGITLADVPLHIQDTSDCTLHAEVPGIRISSGGTFTVNVLVRQADGTIPAALFTSGVHELKVIDTTGYEGTVDVTIAGRTLNVSPPASGPGSRIVVSGTGFPAADPVRPTVSVGVEYFAGTSCTETATGFPDQAGNISVAITVPRPSCVVVPSNNLVVVSAFFGSDTLFVEVASHQAVAVAAGTDLSVAKSASPDPVVAGDDLTYTLTATNETTGSNVATGVFVVDTLPSGVAFKTATPSQGATQSSTGTDVVWDIGQLAGGQSETLKLVVTVDPSTPDGTVLSNHATISGNEVDPNSTNDQADIQTMVTGTVGPSARDLKAGTLEKLKTILGLADFLRSSSERLDQAAKDVSRSLREENWVNDQQLVSSLESGEIVFSSELKAAEQLGEILAVSNEVTTNTQMVLDNLLAADRSLALNMIQEVESIAGQQPDDSSQSDDLLAQARQQLAQGDLDRSNGEVRDALVAYSESWKLALKAMETLQAGLPHISEVTVSNGKSYQIGDLNQGERVYIDRTYTFSDIPEMVRGKEFIRTANDDKYEGGKEYLAFTLSAPATVYVLFDDRVVDLPAWLDDGTWVLATETVNTTDGLRRIYEKNFPAGRAQLVGNAMPPMKGAQSNYNVVVDQTGTS